MTIGRYTNYLKNPLGDEEYKPYKILYLKLKRFIEKEE